MWDSFLTLIGRFHPIVIHLPIGFIIIGLLIELNRKKFKESNNILKFIFFWGTISCLVSIISGYFQYLKEGLLWQSVDGHFYAGIITLLLTFGFYKYLKDQSLFNSLPRKFYTIGLAIIITITGHLGGEITHGEEYLTEPFQALINAEPSEENSSFTIVNISEQPMFNSLIQPILNNKCIGCHGLEKSRGGLQLHTFEAIQKGGEDGPILNIESPELSELFIRVHLPEKEKGHMPPEGKKQLAKYEIEILAKWISLGAPSSSLIKDLDISDKLLSNFIQKKESFFPEIDANSPNNNSISSLKEKGIHIAPISESSNLLSLSSYNYHEFIEEDISALKKLRNNIVDLDLSNSSFNDEIFEILSTFSNLTRLKLNETSISGKGIERLSALENLKSISLVNTSIDSSVIIPLLDFPSLDKVYLFQSDRNFSEEIQIPDEKLKIFEFGNYSLNNL